MLAVARSLVQGAPQLLRMVTWNVADNSGMDKSIEPGAMDILLGLKKPTGEPEHKDVQHSTFYLPLEIGSTQPTLGGLPVADIFAVGLQENCWLCDKKLLPKIPEEFRKRLTGEYEVIGIKATREASDCSCLKHGTTALFVIAKKGVVKSYKAFNYLSGCSTTLVPNKEKGVAYMRLWLTNGKSVCLATSHLESTSPKPRRECLKNFLDDAEKNLQWSSGCDYRFISGDFNTRTSDQKKGAFTEKTLLVHKEPADLALLEKLHLHDELVGEVPYGKDLSLPHGNMLDFINNALTTKKQPTYQETKITFDPTFKLDMKGGKNRCHHCDLYKNDRPLSWTDRIIFSGAKNLQYSSIDLPGKSDHFPVFGVFELPN